MVINMAGITREEMVARRLLPKLNKDAELCSADIVMILKDSGMHWVPNSWELTYILRKIGLKSRKINKLNYWRR